MSETKIKRSLKELTLNQQYRSHQNIISRDFYDYCLPHSIVYQRAVGFFSSSVFLASPEGFYDFFKNGGTIQLVCSPILSIADIEAIAHGYRNRHLLIKEYALDILQSSEEKIRREQYMLLSWLIATQKIAIKIAVIKPSQGREIYHEKLGVLIDDYGQKIVFCGSANESKTGLRDNFESIDVFRSWIEEEHKRVKRKSQDFINLWKDETPGLSVLPFLSALKSELLVISDQQEHHHTNKQLKNQTYKSQSPGLEESLYIPNHIQLRPHQIQAVKEWFDAKGQGLMEMATGSGKTITALATLAKVYEVFGPPLFVIIICPYLHLVYQWRNQVREFGLDPLVCAESKDKWYEALNTKLFSLAPQKRQILSVIVSNATFISDAFQEILQTYQGRMMLIADEAHNLGAERISKCLPEQAKFRLGLSATPERWHDEDGTQAIFDYFGKKLVGYTLEQALKDNVLCPYFYYPVLVTLTDDEHEEYVELSSKIAKCMGKEDDPEQQQILEILLIRRARLMASAENKIPTLQKMILPYKDNKHILVYCGDGKVKAGNNSKLALQEAKQEEENFERQINAVTQLLGQAMRMQVARYIASTSMKRRKELQHDFKEGIIQALVAIRCLDEGVDIPETEVAFILASSTNPRQFIQRRGRLLRRSPNKEFAKIYDFIVIPPGKLTKEESEYYTVNRQLYRKELVRAWEFARLSQNKYEAMNTLLPLQKDLNLLDVDVND